MFFYLCNCICHSLILTFTPCCLNHCFSSGTGISQGILRALCDEDEVAGLDGVAGSVNCFEGCYDVCCERFRS